MLEVLLNPVRDRVSRVEEPLFVDTEDEHDTTPGGDREAVVDAYDVRSSAGAAICRGGDDRGVSAIGRHREISSLSPGSPLLLGGIRRLLWPTWGIMPLCIIFS